MSTGSQAVLSVASADRLFRLYHQELSQFAFRRLRDRDGAADIVQDAFVRYLDMRIRQVEAPLQPRFFLWRIVGNLTIDVLRRQKRRQAIVSVDDIADYVVDPTPLADSQLASQQELALLKRALSDMPANCRNALLLNRLYGLTHRQIGERMGVSQSMVSKYVMAALRRCHARLNPPAKH